ncbi:bifunctional diaminohydroxyphosphoribosylaminopyrimidine deaminase/5-amino-6-(5-phosphoribosylamino)uracil reductase RibD, partial [Butyricimonas faecihominis]
ILIQYKSMPRMCMHSGHFCLKEILNMVRQEDIEYMRRAMELAERGVGFTNPNPMVGAVIVKGGKVIGEGWHERCGEWHAERNAFKNCTVPAEGATMYVTLEPCCHYGKTPPCTEAIIEHGIARVVVGMEDPNPLVAGKGIALLREAGIEVVCGVEEEALREQNRVFLKYISTKLPWVAMKTAMTLDGKIATRTGDSKWITGAEARAYVHELRHRFMAIVVGIGTAVADDPLLNCRIEGRGVRQPIRVVVDSNARLSLDSQLVKTAGEYRTIVAHTRFAPEESVKALREAGVEMLLCKEKEGLVDVRNLLELLGQSGIDSILLEGGGSLNYTFLAEGLADELYAFIAPKIVGGMNAKTPVEGAGMEKMADAINLELENVLNVGHDVLLKLKVKN